MRDQVSDPHELNRSTIVCFKPHIVIEWWMNKDSEMNDDEHFLNSACFKTHREYLLNSFQVGLFEMRRNFKIFKWLCHRPTFWWRRHKCILVFLQPSSDLRPWKSQILRKGSSSFAHFLHYSKLLTLWIFRYTKLQFKFIPQVLCW